ncbi:MAG: hypothetical protein CVT67_06740 [Actinobacteria bacterium HGW-Actinobacteria-7]|jgi:NADH-quinone oxidoreductase subunit N|nr:MAG: hypothetical protein CVT67_06740 [Actinobacteria bacterium HGW-Actinobacteria-7]
MTGPLSLWLMVGFYLAAALVGLVGDAAGRNRGLRIAGAVLLALGGAAAIFSAWALPAQTVGMSLAAGGGFSLVGGLVGMLGAAVVISDDRAAAIAQGQRVALLALAALGAALAAQATNLIVVAITLETSAVCAYALVASARTRQSAESAIKYFIQGAVATGFLVLGLAVIIGGFVSDGSYDGLSAVALKGGSALLAALLLVIVAFAFKSGVAPFHSWTADAYETAPASSAGMLAGPLKLGAVAVLAVLVSATAAAGAGQDAPLGRMGFVLFPVLCALSLASVLVGSLAALRQRSYTRMLAYAGVAQVGYALISIASGSAPVTLLFAATYAVGTTGAFVAAEAARALRPDWDGSIEGLRGLGRTHPSFGSALAILLTSLAGIPPLVGFWGKFQVFQTAIRQAVWLSNEGASGLAAWYWTITVVGIVGAVVSVAYYGGVLRTVYASDGEDASDAVRSGGASGAVVLGLATVVLATGLLPLAAPFALLIRGFLL